jgi:hypothetical protein
MKESRRPPQSAQTAADLLDYIKPWEANRAAYLSIVDHRKAKTRTPEERRRAFTVIQGGKV